MPPPFIIIFGMRMPGGMCPWTVMSAGVRGREPDADVAWRSVRSVRCRRRSRAPSLADPRHLAVR